MATEIRKVIKEGYEGFYNDAQNKLANLDADIEAKVAEYRAKLAEDLNDDKVRLENILEMCQEEKEFEVPDVVEEVVDEEPISEHVPAAEVLEEVVGE